MKNAPIKTWETVSREQQQQKNHRYQDTLNSWTVDRQVGFVCLKDSKEYLSTYRNNWCCT